MRGVENKGLGEGVHDQKASLPRGIQRPAEQSSRTSSTCWRKWKEMGEPWDCRVRGEW